MEFDGFNPSMHYAFVRARQLEGTYPGDLRQGVWQISNLRISKGWGDLLNEDWPYNKDLREQSIIRGEPPDADKSAKKHRFMSRYQRLHSEFECVKALTGARPVGISFDADSQWIDPPSGRIEVGWGNERFLGAHCVGLVDVDPNGSILIQNSWGPSWGDYGYGHLARGFIDRYCFDMWTFDFTWPISFASAKKGITQEVKRGPQSLLSIPYTIEIFDGDNDDFVGWAFAVAKSDCLDLEELFVKPAYRGRGFGRQLADAALELGASLALPIRMWVPWGDHESKNAEALLATVRCLALSVEPSGVRWAAFRCEQGPTPDRLPELVWVPSRPSLRNPSSTIRPLLLPKKPIENLTVWNETKAARRHELIDKEDTLGLTVEEEAEFERLNLELSRHRAQVAPLRYDLFDKDL